MTNPIGRRLSGIPHVHAFVCHDDPHTGKAAMEESLGVLDRFYRDCSHPIEGQPAVVPLKIDGKLGVKFTADRGQLGIGYGTREWHSSQEIFGKTEKKAAPPSIQYLMHNLLQAHQQHPIIPSLHPGQAPPSRTIVHADLIDDAGLVPRAPTTPVISTFIPHKMTKRYTLIGHTVSHGHGDDLAHRTFNNYDTANNIINPLIQITHAQLYHGSKKAPVTDGLLAVTKAREMLKSDSWLNARDQLSPTDLNKIHDHIARPGADMSYGNFPRSHHPVLDLAKAVKNSACSLKSAIDSCHIKHWDVEDPEGIVVHTSYGPTKFIDHSYDKLSYMKRIRDRLDKQANG